MWYSCLVFSETGHRPICGRPQGISLTSLFWPCFFTKAPMLTKEDVALFRSPGRLFVKGNPRSIRPTERYGNWHSPSSDPYVSPAFSKLRPLCSGLSKSFMCSCKKPSFLSAAGVDLQNIQVLQVWAGWSIQVDTWGILRYLLQWCGAIFFGEHCQWWSTQLLPALHNILCQKNWHGSIWSEQATIES